VPDPILAALYPGGGGGGAAEAIPALRRATAAGEAARAMARLAKDGGIRRAMERFRAAVSGTGDVAQALRDPRVLEVLLPAMGMGDAVGQAGLAARALTADPADPKALPARLRDTRWREAAAALDLHRRGMDALRDPAVQARLERGLRQQRWHEELDAAHPGLSDALVFRQRAAAVKDAYDVLGDPVLRRVVTGALGLPPELAIQPVESQARAVTSRLNLATLADPRAVARIAERYVLQRGTAAAGAAPASGSGSTLLALFA
jgi:hypothetical protein